MDTTTNQLSDNTPVSYRMTLHFALLHNARIVIMLNINFADRSLF